MQWVKDRLPFKDGEYLCITRIKQKNPKNDMIFKHIYKFALNLKEAANWEYSGYDEEDLDKPGFFEFDRNLDPYIINDVEAWLDGVPEYNKEI